jgi:hypothetical protein
VTFPMSRAITTTAVTLAAAVCLNGCTVKKTEVPPLAGPSELGLSLFNTATPDAIPQDGVTQSQIQIVARGPDARPVSGVTMRVETYVGGVLMDYGRLSNRQVTTGSDGIARLSYTAPPALAYPVDNFTVVSVLITPLGTDFANSNTRSLDIRLHPQGPVVPPNGTPVADFVVTPTPVTTYTPVSFDATGTVDDGRPCGADCLYAWDFGDGSQATGQVVGHEFRTAGTFSVRLTVTDVFGKSATVVKVVVVTQTARPTASFTYSPAAPRFGQAVFFNASASTAAPGHRLVAYDWDFGTGREGYAITGDDITFNVTLKVTDDTFQPTGEGVVMNPVRIKVP